VGVLSGSATIAATIPIDDDLTLGAQSYSTGYAVANPGNEDIYIRLTVTNPDGSICETVDPPSLNPLGPGCHSSRFFWQDLDPNWKFIGSTTLTSLEGQAFSVVALLMNQGLYMAIPVLPGKAPDIQRLVKCAAGLGP
jgi:hypothetical protein